MLGENPENSVSPLTMLRQAFAENINQFGCISSVNPLAKKENHLVEEKWIFLKKMNHSLVTMNHLVEESEASG